MSGTSKTTTIVVNADKTITASFVTGATYTLAATSATGQVALSPTGGTYNDGDEVLLNPSKVFGYKFDSWSGDLTGSAVPGKIIMNANKSVVAYYVSVPTYKLTSTATNGIIDISPTGPNYEENTVVTMTAKPDFGYTFTGWTGDVTDTKNPVTLSMNANKNLIANFIYNGAGKIAFATNCGGTSFRSSDGVTYSDDNKSTGGSTYSTSAAIAGTTDDALYQKNRYGKPVKYNIPLPNKTYKVTLMYAEIFHSAVGRRVFDVLIEGVKVSSSLDVYAKVGKMWLITKHILLY